MMIREVSLPLSLLLACGCGGTAGDGAAPVERSAPGLEEIRSATFLGIEEGPGPVELRDGRWEGGPFVEGGAARPAVELVDGLYLPGDLDGDGAEEAVVLLAASSGGSGARSYLAVVARRDGGVENVGTRPLGDRIQLRQARIEGGTIRIEVIQAGPSDAACCPGEMATRAFEVTEEGLTESGPPTVTGRWSLAALADSRWRLYRWNSDEEAPAGPEVTLEFTAEGIRGNAGCNDYFASAADGPQPGSIEIGPVGATRKACGGGPDQVEVRYLGRLSGATSVGYLAGRLRLTYRNEEGVGTMLFTPAP